MLVKEGDVLCLDDIVVKIKELPSSGENHKQSYLSMQAHIGEYGNKYIW